MPALSQTATTHTAKRYAQFFPHHRFIMKNILFIILLTFSINSPGQLAYPYKVYSENGDFYVKSMPFSDQVYTDLGKTIVCKTSDSLKVLYTIPRYFQPDQLFLSNDGKSICFVLDWFIGSLDNDRNVIFFYKEGKLAHTYPLEQFIDSTLNKRIPSLLYKNVEVDSLAEISEGTLVSVGVKKGTNPIEGYLNLNNCFIKDDLIYILTQNQFANIFSLDDGNLIKKLSLKEFTKKKLIYPKPRKIENTEIKIPIQFGLPKLTDGLDYETSFAEKVSLKYIEFIDSEQEEKYKVYPFEISLSIDSSGITNNISVECKKDTILKNEMYRFLKIANFDSSEIPSGIERWYFHHISFFRKKSDDLAIKEREQERKIEHLEHQKKLIADSINGVHIPKDLNDCFLQLNKILSKVDKEEFLNMDEKEAVGMTHFSLGQWIRNNWGLWNGSRLQKYFNDLDIKHPDDMSGIILTSYHRFLSKKEIELENQIKETKEYWQIIKNLYQDSSQVKIEYMPPTIK
jgi:hypothetical protein